jgi:hypothetical protein
MLADSATTGQATFEPEELAEPDELEELEEPEDEALDGAEAFLSPAELPDSDLPPEDPLPAASPFDEPDDSLAELPDFSLSLSLLPPLAGTAPFRLSVR